MAICFFCFFYSPGSHHPLPVRKKFYDHFSREFQKYASRGKVFLVGDTNARLGSVLNDRNSKGQVITNSNKPLFLEFLEYSGLSILNSIYCKGIPTYEIANKKKSILDLCLTNSPEIVHNFNVETTPFGVNSQTCHKALVTTITMNEPEQVPVSVTKRTAFRRLSWKKQALIDSAVLNNIAELQQNGASPDYFLLVDIFSSAKRKFLGIRATKRASPPLSPAMRDLQRRFSRSVEAMERESSAFSFFVADNLEKLLCSQYKHEKKKRFSIWLKKLDDLDFKGRTREFFTEIRKKHMTREEAGPICNRYGKLSDNLTDTLKNWKEYYQTLYSSNTKSQIFPTPDQDSPLDTDLTYEELVDVIYLLKRHKSPGFDHILNEDIISTVLEESNEAPGSPIPGEKLELLKYIYKILSDFWFNEHVPRDFKRTILRPFLKDKDKSCYDPSNYRPISLLNTLMKVYEGIICKRLNNFLGKSNVLSPNQAAYRSNKSASDHILTLHELFLEYRFNKVGPRGGAYRRPLYFCFLDLRKAFDTVPRDILFKKLYNIGVHGKFLRVIQNLFSSNPANVLVGGALFHEFIINRGVLKGSKLGPVLFNIFINDLLREIDSTNLGAKIGPIHIPGLGFADDIVLVSDSPKKLQQLLNICCRWAQQNDMNFNTSKCKVMIFNGSPKDATFKTTKL